MGSYRLDTTVLIDLSRELASTQAAFESLVEAGHRLGICKVVAAEFLSGVRPRVRADAEEFLWRLHDWDITQEIALRAGIYRYTFARQGRQLSTTDALIAATAVSVGATLVTSNVKDYPMPDLSILRLGP